MYIIEAVFFGFTIFNISLVVARIFSKRPKLGMRFTDVGDRIIVWNGLIYSIIVMYQLALSYQLIEYSEKNIGEEIVVYENGPYLIYLAQLLALILATQLFWISRFKKRNYVRILLSVIILFSIKFEKYVIIMTSFHRDYLFSSIFEYEEIFKGSIIELGVFLLVFLISSNFKRTTTEKSNYGFDHDKVIDENI